MSYIPHTELDRKKMLEACGVQNLEDLFDIIPNEHRFPELNMPGPLSELEVLRELQELSESNAANGTTRVTASKLESWTRTIT